MKETAFRNRVLTGVITNERGIKDLSEYLEETFHLFQEKIELYVENGAVKSNIALMALFELPTTGEEELFHFNSRNHVLHQKIDLVKVYENMVIVIMKKLEEFADRGSGWTLQEIKRLDVNVNRHVPFGVRTPVALPDWIKNKKASVNVNNKGAEDSFAWAVVSALHPAKKDGQRTSSYPHYNDVLNLEGILFPLTVEQIPKFER